MHAGPVATVNQWFISLIDVCAHRLNVAAMLPVTSYKTCLCHYITGCHALMSEALQKKAAVVYPGCLIARANRPPRCAFRTRVEGKTYIHEWRTLYSANAWDMRGSLYYRDGLVSTRTYSAVGYWCRLVITLYIALEISATSRENISAPYQKFWHGAAGVTAVYHLRVCWSCNIVNKTTKLKTKTAWHKTKTKTTSLKTKTKTEKFGLKTKTKT